MAKKVSAYIKLQIPAGKANPSPPVGPALGQHGVNIMEFCKAFNAQTQNIAWSANTGCDYGLYRSQLYLHHENTSSRGVAEKGAWYS